MNTKISSMRIIKGVLIGALIIVFLTQWNARNDLPPEPPIVSTPMTDAEVDAAWDAWMGGFRRGFVESFRK